MRFLAALYRFAMAACCFAGTYEVWHLRHYSSLVYFTFQTTLLLGVVMLWTGAATLLKGIQPPAWLKGCLTLYSVIAGLVALFVLPAADPAITPRVFGLLTVTWAHRVVPVGALLDWLLFDPHRRFKWPYALWWMAYLPVYVAGVLIRAAIWPHSGPLADGTPYPYDFLNLPVLGWTRLGINIVEYGGVFLALGLILIIIDRALPQKVLVAS
ncbi:Pr6Pr family membrane protein [Bifidobacterium callimiconis]|uniref:Pr6Pr family membrane protein n=1 Tax=Bifidobacterium callimiconis TaxID=2306973 RepID=UPI000F7D67B9|nr:Pr6Pr family membrane protein [Bifidobacterium callimiconis]